MLFDIHIHTNLSPCSVLGTDTLLESAALAGIDGICVTDHQTMNIRHHLTEGRQENGLTVIFGMEYTTADGDFLIFGPYEELPKNMAADDLLIHVRNTGGVAVAAHPFRKIRPVSEHPIAAGLCPAMESVNGRNTVIENLQASQWRNRYHLVETGGSDAHSPAEVGRVVTRFETPIHNRQDLIDAIRDGRCRPEIPDRHDVYAPALNH